MVESMPLMWDFDKNRRLKISLSCGCVLILQKLLVMLSLLRSFRIIALLEGVSYILLLFIAVPIKYLADDPQYVQLLGMPHGLLFMAYIVLAFMVASELKWSKKVLYIVLAASIIPFGTFFVDKKYLKSA